ncbi:MAG: RagB/SusD family nutrient uptake outer membrane protein, partial [Muribaculaceae bacterium]|nr:RagB/SusD family nutrient uptake outer membrane protein [Muribaculaceae bacterium]
MKNIFKYILPAFCILASSCSLDETSYTEIGKNTYMNTAAEAETVLQGIYAKMSNEYMYSYHLSLLFTISSDIAQCEGSATSSFREIPTNTHTSTTSQISRTWQQLYAAIYSANEFIENMNARISGWTGLNRQQGEVYIAEARALRALFYFELVRWYGNVPLITSTAQSSWGAGQYEQADPVDVYKFIESDLLAASQTLPWAMDDQIRANTAYRMSRGAALGLLAKVYCTWAGYPVQDTTKWADAAKVARQVVESGKHSLIPDYETVWYNTCN